MNGVSLLVSKLKSHHSQHSSSVWASHESVKLTDSIANPEPEEELADMSVEQFREQLASLIRQTNEQEKALLMYHAEMGRIKDENDRLKIRLVQKNLTSSKLSVFSAWRSLRTTSTVLRTPEHHAAHTVMVHESVNLNDTLRNLALSLASPFNDKHAEALNNSSCNQLNVSTSTVKSALAIPFQTVRRQKNFPHP